MLIFFKSNIFKRDKKNIVQMQQNWKNT